jgi:hypothetical protein
MLSDTQIDALTKDARPVDYRMLRSYIRRAPSVEYVRRTMLPSLKRLHPQIWQYVASQAVKA